MTTIGSVRVAVEWGQPQMRGRDIWGALVPWGAVWMPGADEATVLTTDGAVTIGTVEVPAGDHTLYAEPTADRFELLISRDVGVFHTVRNPALIIGRTDMTLNTTSDSVEGLTFTLRPASDGHTGTLSLSWDKREYGVGLTER